MGIAGMRLIAGVCLILSAGVFVNVLMLQGGPSGRDEGMRSAAVGAGLRSQPAARDEGTLHGQPAAQPSRQLVRAVQRELATRGYLDGKPSGTLDLVTRAAIMAYEADQGYALTGETDDALLRSLLLGTGLDERRTRGPVGEGAELVIAHVQSLLIKAGYARVERSGKLDEATLRAIQQFEERLRLQPTGRISAKLLRQLQAEVRQG